MASWTQYLSLWITTPTPTGDAGEKLNLNFSYIGDTFASIADQTSSILDQISADAANIASNTAALALLAPLASPTFTGTVNAATLILSTSLTTPLITSTGALTIHPPLTSGAGNNLNLNAGSTSGAGTVGGTTDIRGGSCSTSSGGNGGLLNLQGGGSPNNSTNTVFGGAVTIIGGQGYNGGTVTIKAGPGIIGTNGAVNIARAGGAVYLSVDDNGLGFFGSSTTAQQTGNIITGLNALGLVTGGTITESNVTNLTSDLAAKAALASPTFTGTPAAPTATAGTNTTQLATTAFVTGGISTHAALTATHGVSGAIVGTSDSQTLTNKTLGTTTFTDATNIVVGSTTGTKIGTATSQKIGFFNATPVVQQTGNVITGLGNLGLITSGTIAQADITGLTSALALLAPLASPTFTGTVSAATVTASGPIYAGTNAGGSVSGAVTLNPALGSNVSYTFTGNVTLTVSNGSTTFQKLTIAITQDATGSRTLTWGGSNVNLGTDITATTLTTTASKTDYIILIWRNAASKWDVASIVKGF